MLIVTDFFWEAEGRWAIGNGKLVTYTRKSKTNLYFFFIIIFLNLEYISIKMMT